MTKELFITTAKDMVSLGFGLCSSCKGGEVFVLSSDLGGGKTTLVRGMARAIGEEDSVSSPSFTLQNTYRGKTMTIEHFDFYRLDEPGIMAYELQEAITQKNTIVAVEWPGIVDDTLPSYRIQITITTTEKKGRLVSIEYPDEYAYVIKGIAQ